MMIFRNLLAHMIMACGRNSHNTHRLSTILKEKLNEEELRLFNDFIQQTLNNKR